MVSVDGAFETVLFAARRLTMVDETEVLPPLFPLQFADYLGLGAATLGLILAAGGGIGGGGILVPIYILLLDFPVKHAIPLASVTVFGGAVANNLFNVNKSHPVKPYKFLIDWDLVLQLEPMTMLGTLVGAGLNDWLPDLVLILMLLLVLGVTAQKTLAKAHKLHQAENTELEESSALLGSTATSYGGAAVATNGGATVDDDTSIPDPKLVRRHFFGSAIKLTVFFVIVTVINLLKGGDEEGGEGPYASQGCGVVCFWMSELFIVAAIGGFAVWVRWTLLKRMQNSENLSDIAWNEENTLRYPALATGAGLMAGLFGIGGGIIKGPLMLALGVHPAVASATSACMILYTSATATVSYAVFGFLVYDYAAACLVLGFTATVVGQSIMSWILSRYKRNSYIAYSIGLVVALSAVCMSIESIIALFE